MVVRLAGGPAEPGGADDTEWSSRPARLDATCSVVRRGGPRVATDRLAIPDSELDSFYGRGPSRLWLGSTVILPSSER